ncbi:hypothetical protein FGB62_254g011 [Gracilaria domingensis]|nr:hypothetical protein FGB62_254g011 [Gracilaria domingensis]
MQQLSECEQHIQQTAAHIRDCENELKHATQAVQLAQTIGVLALRVITAFKSIAHACQTLSASQLATLIDLTCSPSPEQPAARQGELSVLDASQSALTPKWVMKTAVKQKFVQYFAQWAALKHCCQQCLEQLPTEEEHSVPQLCWGAFESDGFESDAQSLLPSSSDGTDRQHNCVTLESHDAERVSASLLPSSSDVTERQQSSATLKSHDAQVVSASLLPSSSDVTERQQSSATLEPHDAEDVSAISI